MGTCLSKKTGSSTSTAPAKHELKKPGNDVTVSKPRVETDPEVKLKEENNKTVQEKHELVQEDKSPNKKEIFIIKHRKSHDDRERNSKSPLGISQQNAPQPATEADDESMCDKVAPEPPTQGVAVRTSSCTKEEVDALLIQCGRLSRSSSGKAASSSSAAAFGEHRRRYSGSKRSFDFDHCDNDTISTDEDQKKASANCNNNDLCEDDGREKHHQHRPRHQSPRSSSSQGRRRTPSREREQQQRSSSRERRVSRSPVRRSETTNANNNSNSNSSRPGKIVSVPATVSSLVMDKINNGGGGVEESAAATGVRRIAVKRNVGAASPRSQSPARANGNAANAPSLSRNSSRKAEQSPYRRNPLSEVDPNSLAHPQSEASNNSSRVQNRPKKEIETDANQKPNANSRVALDKAVSANCKTKVQQEADVKVHSSMTDNVVVKTVVPPGVDNLKPQTLTRSRSSRQSRDLDLNTEALLTPPRSYTSLLLEDIQNFHQKNTPSVSLPACVSKACSILEAVADLNSTNSSNFSGAFIEDKKSPPTYQSSRNEYNVPLGTNHYGGKRGADTKDKFVESEVVVNDDVMEPSFHKYVTVNRGGSLGGVDMEDQESSGSNSFTFSSGQQHWGICSSSWEPNSADSKDSWTSRLNNSREESQKCPLGLEGSVSSEAGRDMDGARKKLNIKRRECDHKHSNGIGRGRLGVSEGLHTIPVVTAAAST